MKISIGSRARPAGLGDRNPVALERAAGVRHLLLHLLEMLVHLLRGVRSGDEEPGVGLFRIDHRALHFAGVLLDDREGPSELLLVGAELAGGAREFLVGRGRGAGRERVAADLACRAGGRFRQRKQRRRHCAEHRGGLEHLGGRVLEAADDRRDPEIQVGEMRRAGRDRRADAAQRRAGRDDRTSQRRTSALRARHRCRRAADLTAQRLRG